MTPVEVNVRAVKFDGNRASLAGSTRTLRGTHQGQRGPRKLNGDAIGVNASHVNSMATAWSLIRPHANFARAPPTLRGAHQGQRGPRQTRVDAIEVNATHVKLDGYA